MCKNLRECKNYQKYGSRRKHIKLIQDHLCDSRDDIIADILSMTAIPSESNDRGNTAKALDRALEIACRMGFHTEKRAGGEIGVVSFGEGAETVGILAHVDVVPIGDPADWAHSPYGELADNILYGRGVVDDKGPLILCLYALKAVSALDIPLHKKVQIIIGSREEIIWDDIRLYRKEGHALPDYGFTPDGEFPIANREKGYCETLVTFPHKMLASYDIEITDIQGGGAINSVPGKAAACINGDIAVIKMNEKLEVKQDADVTVLTASGKEVHSSVPWDGDNALVTLFEAFEDATVMDDAYNKAGEFLRELFDGGAYEGARLGYPQHPSEVNGEEMGATVVTPSVIYEDEQGLHIYLSARTVCGTTLKESETVFNTLSQKYGFQYQITDNLDPLHVSKEHKFIRVLAQSYEEVRKKPAEINLANGTSYAKALPCVVSFGPTFPGDPDTAHRVDEQASVPSLMEAAEIYALSLYNALTTVELLGK